MNIIDTFPYFNEKELLEFRIKLLYDHVDKFIICDANRTHSNIPKEFTLRKTLKELNLPLDKIKIVEVDLSSYDSDLNNWSREHAQRNAAQKFITINDIFIVSDCDEIINPKYIEYYATVAQQHPNNILRIPMTFLHNRADLHICTIKNNMLEEVIWNTAFMCLKSHLNKYSLSQIREANTFSNFHDKQIEFSDIYAYDNGVIENAGWHFSWMGNSNNLINKYKSTAHYNDMPNSINMEPEDKAIEFIKNYKPTENGNDVLGRSDHILKQYDINLLPDLLFTLPNILNLVLPSNIYFEKHWINYPELYLEIVNKFPSGSKFIEIGSQTGQSAIFMCDIISNSNKDIDFFCIDAWENDNNSYKNFLKNMSPFEEYYIPIKLNSIDASKRFKNRSLDFIFINNYENIKLDINTWLPKLKNGGIIACLAEHDYDSNNLESSNVYIVLNELFDKNLIRQLNDCFIININN